MASLIRQNCRRGTLTWVQGPHTTSRPCPARLYESLTSRIPQSTACAYRRLCRSENAGVPTIREIMIALFALVASSFRTRAALQTEILALRHQLAVCQKNAPRRLRLHRCDRLLWVVLYRFWSGWRRCFEIVRPDTVLRWHRRAFALRWTRESRRLPGRPEVAADIRDLIRRMSQANPLWGAPRIPGELLKLGICRGAIHGGQIFTAAPQTAFPESKITALVLGWAEDSVVRSDSRGCGVAGSFSKCAFASIVW